LLASGCASLETIADRGARRAERTDPALQRAVEALAADFDGVVGLYVRHLPSGRSASLRADTLFPTASMVKVPILVATFDRIERGELDYSADLVFRDSLRYSSDDLFGELRDSASVPLHQAVELMLSASDNTASLWLQQLAGGGEAINRWLDAHGFVHTRVNSRTPGRRPDWERYGWGQTTPREMAELLRRIAEGEAVSPGADDEMHRSLTRTFYDDEAVSALPPWVQAATKQGAVSRSRSEVAYVHAPGGPFVFCVVTKEQADTRWEADNAGYALIRAATRLFWETFESGSTWRPPAGAERYRL
jgi:beta-lactamase class A